MPASVSYQVANAGEQLRIVLLDPVIEYGLVVVEDEARMCFAELSSDAEGRNRLREPILPVPQPDRVQMGIADQMNLFLGHIASVYTT